MGKISDFIFLFKETKKKLNEGKTHAKELIDNAKYVLNMLKQDYESFDTIIVCGNNLMRRLPSYRCSVSKKLRELYEIYLYTKKCVKTTTDGIDRYNYIDTDHDNTPQYKDYPENMSGLEKEYVLAIQFGEDCIRLMEKAYKEKQFDKVHIEYGNFKKYAENMHSKFGMRYIDLFSFNE